MNVLYFTLRTLVEAFGLRELVKVEICLPLSSRLEIVRIVETKASIVCLTLSRMQTGEDRMTPLR